MNQRLKFNQENVLFYPNSTLKILSMFLMTWEIATSSHNARHEYHNVNGIRN